MIMMIIDIKTKTGHEDTLENAIWKDNDHVYLEQREHRRKKITSIKPHSTHNHHGVGLVSHITNLS